MKFWLDRGDSIFLYQLLKGAGVEDDYTRIRLIIDRGLVQVNGENVFKQRYEVRNGDVVTYHKHHIKVLDRREENLPVNEEPVGNVRHGRVKQWKAKPLITERELDEKITRLALKLHGKLQNQKRTIALAESCTGGLIQEIITRQPGSSAYFLGGIVSYANEVKSGVLGVDENTLHKHGAVSAQTAEAMAAACKKLFNSDLAAAVTGIAGPDGGTGEKPVGTVHIAFAIDNRVMSRLLTLRGDRALIRKQAAYNILRFIADKC